MKIKQYVQALRDLVEDTDLDSRIESLTNYSSAHIIWKSHEQEVDAGEYSGSAYILEKLALFISYFDYAVMPRNGDSKTPEYWLEAAKEKLSIVESKVCDQEGD